MRKYIKPTNVKTVGELVELLKEYPEDTAIFNSYVDSNERLNDFELVVMEGHEIGDRDAEDIPVIHLSNKKHFLLS